MSTITERLQSDLAVVEEQLVSANTALQDILDSQIESYDIEGSDNTQKATNIKVDKLSKLISYLETKRERIYGKIYGGSRCVSMRLRR